jgi:hypothetical protein
MVIDKNRNIITNKFSISKNPVTVEINRSVSKKQSGNFGKGGMNGNYPFLSLKLSKLKGCQAYWG